jgi:transcription elongation factor GreA
MDRQPISRGGFIKLQEQLRNLKESERPAILDAVQRARDLGDLSENADYKTAKDQQRQIDSEIGRLERIIGNANIIDTGALAGETVMFGASVIIKDDGGKLIKYKILAECESDLSNGIIANTSPLARGLIGKSIGDSCVIRTPAGDKEYEIMDVRYN